MLTRKDYLDQSNQPGAFARYYGEIIEAAGGAEAFRHRLPVSLAEIKAALASGDEHLNSIPLGKWDAHSLPHIPKAAAALRERGDYPTLGNAVCILKEAARLLAEDDAA